jgi:hypothetical protein
MAMSSGGLSPNFNPGHLDLSSSTIDATSAKSGGTGPPNHPSAIKAD